ncbi:MAG: response regulator transcription factor [Elusimicrobiota bacterium]|nr:response regulator transcription factor [Elusimicrobiota bacterium]
MRHSRRVLVVDDEQEQRRLFCRFLSSRRYQPVAVSSAMEALASIPKLRPHLILADIAMPVMDGVALLGALRVQPATAALPVILMTGLSIPDCLLAAAAKGLGSGPIYAKGQSLHHLEHRIEEELRSSPRSRESDLRRGGLVVDTATRSVWVDGHAVHVAGHRFDLLSLLLRVQGPVSRRVLLKAIWPNRDNPNIVDVNLLRLRRDLESCPSVTIESSADGYRLAVASVSRPITSVA